MLTTKAKDRLEKLVAYLGKQLNTPSAARFNMEQWGDEFDEENIAEASGLLAIPPCNTQACLAGETVLMLRYGKIQRQGGIQLNSRARQAVTISDAAADALDLTLEQRRRLFIPYSSVWIADLECWPKQFQDRYDRAKSPNARIRVAQARIRHFIKTDGEE